MFGAGDYVGRGIDVADRIVQQGQRHRCVAGRQLILGVDDVLTQFLLEGFRLLDSLLARAGESKVATVILATDRDGTYVLRAAPRVGASPKP